MENKSKCINIEKIILHKLEMKLKYPFLTNYGVFQDKQFFVVEALDGKGYQGFGESVAFPTPWYTEETVKTNEHIMEDFLIPIIFREKIRHPDELSNCFSIIKRNNMAKAAIEGAIWDLYAKIEGKPLAEAIGGKKTEIKVGVAIGIQETVKDLLKKIEHVAQEGYKRVKLKIKPGWDTAILREVRQHFPNLPIMADANSAYKLADIKHLKKLDEFDLVMIEQPLGQDDLMEHSKLQKHLDTPICLDESIHSFEDAKTAIALGSCEIINIKIGRVGGITEAKRIHHFCKENGIKVWCGGMLEAGIGRAHNIAISTLDNFVLPGDTAGSARYWEEDIITPEVVVENGMIKVPNQPGIGFEINRSALEKFTIEKKIFTNDHSA